MSQYWVAYIDMFKLLAIELYACMHMGILSYSQLGQECMHACQLGTASHRELYIFFGCYRTKVNSKAFAISILTAALYK